MRRVSIFSVVALVGAGIMGDASAASCAGRTATVAKDRVYRGTAADEVIVGTTLSDIILGGGGDDLICGRGGDDLLVGGDGNDRILGQGDDDALRGGRGVDALNGGRGSDFIAGGTDADTSVGGRGNDLIRSVTGSGVDGGDSSYGGAGHDQIWSSTEDASADGGRGSDLVDFENEDGSGVVVDLNAGAAVGEGKLRLTGVESAEGTSYPDELMGDSSVNVLLGGDGDDVVRGRGGDDWLGPGFGFDRVGGGEGFDVMTYADTSGPDEVDPVDGDGSEDVSGIEALQGPAGSGTVVGTPGDDILLGRPGANLTFIPGAGDDQIATLPRTNSAWDKVSFAKSPGPVQVNLVEGWASGEGEDILVGIDEVITTPFDDEIVGSGSEENYTLGAGDDVVFPSEGSDDVIAGPGNDKIVGESWRHGPRVFGGPGHDQMFDYHEGHGGDGNDTLLRGFYAYPGSGDDVVDEAFFVDYRSAPGGLIVDLAAGTVTGAGNDRVTNVRTFHASEFRDEVWGTHSKDSISTWGGHDLLVGRGGDDFLDGDSGNDTIYGGPGDDWLIGSHDNRDAHDRIWGGEGDDRCNMAHEYYECESGDVEPVVPEDSAARASRASSRSHRPAGRAPAALADAWRIILASIRP